MKTSATLYSEKLFREAQNNEMNIAAAVKGTAASCKPTGRLACHQAQKTKAPGKTKRWDSTALTNETA